MTAHEDTEATATLVFRSKHLEISKRVRCQNVYSDDKTNFFLILLVTEVTLVGELGQKELEVVERKKKSSVVTRIERASTLARVELESY